MRAIRTTPILCAMVELEWGVLRTEGGRVGEIERSAERVRICIPPCKVVERAL